MHIYKNIKEGLLLTVTCPFASFGGSHCITTVLELKGIASTLRGALPGSK